MNRTDLTSAVVVPGGSRVDLSTIDPDATFGRSKDDAKVELERGLEDLKSDEGALALESRLRRGDGSFQRMHWSASFSPEEDLIYARIRPARSESGSGTTAVAAV